MPKLKVSKIAHFTGHKDAVFALGPSLKDSTFYSGGADGYIVEWDMQSRENGKLLLTVPRPVYSLHLIKSRQILACGTAEGHLHIIDLQHGKELKNIEAHQAGIFDIKETDNYLLTAGGDGNLMVWDKATFSLNATLSYGKKSARVIALHPDNKEFAVGYSDCFIRVFSLNNLEILHSQEAHTNSIFGLTYNLNGDSIISGGRDVMLKKWSRDKPELLLANIAAHNLHINCIQFNKTGNIFATASMDKTIKIWDAQDFTLIKVIDNMRNKGHLSSVNKIMWCSNTQFISCGDDRAVMMWEIEPENI